MRKYILLFLLCLTLSTLTGCEWVDNIKTAFEVNSNESDAKGILNKFKGGTYSAESMDAATRWSESMSNFNNIATQEPEKQGLFMDIVNGIRGMGFGDKAVHEYKVNEARKQMDIQKTAMESAMFRDELMAAQTAREEAEAQGKEDKEIPWMLILIVGGVAAVAALLLRLRSRPKAAPMSVAATPAKETRKVARTKDLDVNAKLACEGICKKYNLNLDKELSKVGGNYTELLNQFIMMGKT